ncbi:MAG: phage minor capsid protein [Acutalibacteraceae bacterium]|nr:phage minor capsid protein [Acutalibacteraceae bacterium]
MSKLTYEQALAKLYTEAEAKLIKIIKRKVRYGNATVYERSLLRQIDEQIEILRKSSDKLVQELVKSNYKKGLDQLLKDISPDKTAPHSYNLMSRLNVNQINIIVDNITQQLNQAIATVGRRCSDYIRQITLEATAKKLTQGQTVRQMQKELEAQLEESNITSISYANGAKHNIKDYASMVARTTTAETQNTAQVVQGNAWGYDLVRMTSHYPTCKVCAMYQGRVYALTKEAANGKYKDKNGKPLGFAYLYDTALVDGYNTIHPNCRHRFAILPARAYTLDELAEFSRQSMQPFEDTRSDEERKAYAKEQAIKRKRNESRRQYEKFKSDFPDQAPKTFAVWQRKRNKSRRQYEDVKRSLPDQAPKTFAVWWRMESANSQRYQDLMDDYRTSQKSVDNSAESGISGKEHSASESNTVDLKYISSKEYHSKFIGLTGDTKVDERIYEQSKAMLIHRSKTDKEDMCLIDSRNGNIAGRQTNSKSDFGVDYNDSIKNAISKYPRDTLISIHNHPTNNPPTGSDIVSNGGNGYKFGIVVTHNGKVFTYKAGNKPFTATSFGKTVDKYRGGEYNLSEYEAIIKTLDEYKRYYEIEWSELL